MRKFDKVKDEGLSFHELCVFRTFLHVHHVLSTSKGVRGLVTVNHSYIVPRSWLDQMLSNKRLQTHTINSKNPQEFLVTFKSH